MEHPESPGMDDPIAEIYMGFQTEEYADAQAVSRSRLPAAQHLKSIACLDGITILQLMPNLVTCHESFLRWVGNQFLYMADCRRTLSQNHPDLSSTLYKHEELEEYIPDNEYKVDSVSSDAGEISSDVYSLKYRSIPTLTY